MGLDMYIYKTKKIPGLTFEQIEDIEGYLEYLERPDKYANCSLKEWCGINEDSIIKEKVDEVKRNIHTTYSAWDDEHKYPHNTVIDNVAYWRKANEIHNWFVQNCGDGIDECQNIHLNRNQLESLLAICIKVADSCELVEGQVNNGWEFKDGKEIPIVVNGKYIKDPSVAKELLPTSHGFFFGSYDYDQWYMADIESTIEQIREILNTTDFDKEHVVYRASW